MRSLHSNFRAGIAAAALLAPFPTFAQSASDSSASGTPGTGTTSGPGAQSPPNAGPSVQTNEGVGAGETGNDRYPTVSEELDTGPSAKEPSDSPNSSTHNKLKN